MKLTFEYDPDDGQILAAYLQVLEGQVSRTVEVAEGECYVDEDCEGKLLGVELICPVRISELIETVATRYPAPGLKEAFSNLK